METEVGGKIGGAPLAVSLGAREDAGAWSVENRTVHPAPSILHANLDRACHLASALLTEGCSFGFFAVGHWHGGHMGRIAVKTTWEKRVVGKDNSALLPPAGGVERNS